MLVGQTGPELNLFTSVIRVKGNLNAFYRLCSSQYCQFNNP